LGMKKVGNLIEKVFRKLGLAKRYNEQKAVLVWEEVVGKRISEKAKPLYVRDGKLVIEVENSAWMSELHFLKREVIDKLNKRLGGFIIEDIHFLLKRE
jgi:predicted nucleic acid-binding Zn ribbon protein